jgi:predicted HTH domain antitoxin
MHNLQIRLADDELAEVEELTKVYHKSRSEVARNALHEGIRALKMDIALRRFLRNEFSLARAAGFAGVSIQEMSDFLARSDVPFFRYSPKELDADAGRAKKALRAGE